MTLRPDRSFLAPPDEVSDWRMVLVYDAAADAGVLSALPGTPAEAAGARGLDERAVRVALDVLAVWGIVEQGGDGRFRPGTGAPDADLAALHRHHARSMRSWAEKLDDRLRGVADARAGAPPPGRRELWYAALAAYARPAAPAVVDACLDRFPGARRVLDLGGGHGEHALAFARRGLSVAMLDRPETVELARRTGRFQAAGVELVAGDFFTSVPEGPFDIVFAAAVTDTFDGTRNTRLYRIVRPVVAEGGGIALLAFVRGRNPVVAAFAVQMLGVGAGGDTHSEDDYRTWLQAGGFDGVEVTDVAGLSQSLVVGRGGAAPAPV